MSLNIEYVTLINESSSSGRRKLDNVDNMLSKLASTDESWYLKHQRIESENAIRVSGPYKKNKSHKRNCVLNGTTFANKVMYHLVAYEVGGIFSESNFS